MTCRMGEPIRTGVRVCMPRIGIGKVCMPIIGNRSAYKAGGDDVLKDLKKHMLGWYDVKRQGCTNESLAENPVLEDLSGNNHPLELKNFAFGGLSGMGGYGTDLTKWVTQGGAILSERTPHKVTVHLDNTVIGYRASFRFQNDNKERYDYFKVRTSVPGNMTYSLLENVSNTMSCYSEDKMTFEVYGKGIYRATFMPDNDVLDYTIEILPNFPNSLVFNGVTPEYVINKDNVTLSNVATAVGVNKFKLTGNQYRAISYYITGKAGESLTVSIPSFIVRVTGIEAKSIVHINYKDSTGKDTRMNLVKDGTYIVPAINYTLDAKEDGSAIKEEAIRILTDGNIHDVTLESLPNYPAPTTNNYGIIPSLTQGAKCMMMDVTPLTSINSDYENLYTQRGNASNNNYAILIIPQSKGTVAAYNDRNDNGTYINGKYNRILKSLDITQKRQVISVNAATVINIPIGIIVGCGEQTTKYRNAIMALNSLILFDRELTEKEMKLVMDKLMKYEDTDNIAGDLSRSANVLSLDDSGMYEEYDAYEEGNGAEDVREME